MDGDRAIELIFQELRSAERNFPGWPDDPIHGVAILMEEAGEAIKEANDVRWKGKANSDLITELAQTGAMAIRALMSMEEEKS